MFDVFSLQQTSPAYYILFRSEYHVFQTMVQKTWYVNLLLKNHLLRVMKM